MGDDLTAARHFCDIVRGDITLLIDGMRAQPPASPDILLKPVDRIQSHAKFIQARGIFRAAQTVANSLLERAPLPTVQGRALSLNTLITQYETGLDDIAPRPANQELDEAMRAKSETPAMVYATVAPPMPDVAARFRAARDVLAPLMVHAPQGQDRDALIKLAKFSENELPTSVFEAPQKAVAENQLETLMNFEMLMPDFIGQALQEARQIDKTVSVSYAADGVSFSKSQLHALQNLFDHIAKTLVRSVLERPEMRRARGLSGAGHIALTATQTPQSLIVSIECPGAPLTINAYSPVAGSSAPSAVLDGLSIASGTNANDGLAHIVLTVPRRAKAGPAESQIKYNSTEMAS